MEVIGGEETEIHKRRHTYVISNEVHLSFLMLLLLHIF